MLALAAAPLPKLKLKTCGGLSGSVARLVITSCVPTAMVWLAIAARTGGLLSGRTTTEKLWVAVSEGEPLSLTMTLKALVPTCATVGVQLKTPLAGSMLALAAALLQKLRVKI